MKDRIERQHEENLKTKIIYVVQYISFTRTRFFWVSCTLYIGVGSGGRRAVPPPLDFHTWYKYSTQRLKNAFFRCFANFRSFFRCPHFPWKRLNSAIFLPTPLVMYTCSKNNVISSVRKYYCALGIGLELGLWLEEIRYRSNVFLSKFNYIPFLGQKA